MPRPLPNRRHSRHLKMNPPRQNHLATHPHPPQMHRAGNHQNGSNLTVPPQIIRKRLNLPQRPKPPHRNPLHLRRPATKQNKKMPLLRRNRQSNRQQIKLHRQSQLPESPHLKSRHTKKHARRHSSPKQLQPINLPHRPPSQNKYQIKFVHSIPKPVAPAASRRFSEARSKNATITSARKLIPARKPKSSHANPAPSPQFLRPNSTRSTIGLRRNLR